MLFLFNAITDYINATKDYQFLSEVLSYYPKESGKTGTVIEHLKYAWNHQVKYVGTGPNGLIKLRDSDWDDIMHQLNCGDDVSCTEKSESVLNTAIATYVYPRLAKMIRKNGDQSWADEIDKTNEGLKAALRKQWNGKWFTRALINKGNSTKVIGSDQLHLAAQPWAILSNNLNTEEEQNLLNTIHSQLTGPLGARLVNDGS
jgi:cellobiose phosphorylase